MPSLEYRLLSPEEIADLLKSHSEWKVAADHLVREFAFESYQEGLVFSSAVGFLADKLDHHPDIHIAYKKVKVSVSTHATKGLSPYDFELASRIDAIL
jgi:4a-hydroxytetrahydrobiopterin dehydratase